MMDRLNLPVLIAGERIEHADAEHSFEYGGGLIISSPKVDRTYVNAALATDKSLLKALHLEEIALFLDEVGKAWLNPKNPWREMAMKYGPAVTGYPPDNIERDLNFVGSSMIRPNLIDLIDTDLGDAGVLDDWTRYKSVHYRAWPKGLAAHIMVGNVPLAGFFTLIRSLATKNITIAKTSSRDVLIPQCLVQCIHDVDPTHPVVKALTALYWESESEIENDVLQNADVVTVWGRAQSIAAVKNRVPYGTDVVEFGPKRSLAIVDTLQLSDMDTTAMWLSFDVMNYNQEACFSTQEIFCVGPVDELVAALKSWLTQFGEVAAPTYRVPDADAHVLRARIEAQAQGWTVHAPHGADWSVIVTNGPCRIDHHPLGRTVFIHPCEGPGDVLPLIDDNVQGVAFEPFAMASEWADVVSALGACRIIPVGKSCRMREGFIHDGFHPMRRLIRWSIIEREDAGTARVRNRPPAESNAKYKAWAHRERSYHDIASYGGYRSFDERRLAGLATFAPVNAILGAYTTKANDELE